MWQYQKTEELYHHGVLGMRWGYRRYQNKDGSLTPAGRRRANKLADQYAKVTGKKLVVKKKTVSENREKSINEMSNEELQRKINRLRLEETYKNMTASQLPKQKVSKGKTFINNIKKNIANGAYQGLSDATKNVVSKFLTNQGNKLINKGLNTASNKVKNKTNDTIKQAIKNNNTSKATRDAAQQFINNDLGTYTFTYKKKK